MRTDIKVNTICGTSESCTPAFIEDGQVTMYDACYDLEGLERGATDKVCAAVQSYLDNGTFAPLTIGGQSIAYSIG